jgi:hypothetical protein
MANTVTVPGGSSTVSVPPSSGGAPAPSSAWDVIGEIDLTGVTPRNFLTAGTATDSINITVDGRTVAFEAAGGGSALSTYASQFEINGSGLQITPVVQGANSPNDQFTGNNTCPRFGPKINDIFPSYDYEGDVIAVQAYMTASITLNVNYMCYGLVLDKHTTSSNEWFSARAIHAAGAIKGETIRYNQEHPVITAPANPDFFEIVVFPRMGSVEGTASDWQGSFPEPRATMTPDAGWTGARGGAEIKGAEGPTAAANDPNTTNGYLSVSALAPFANATFTLTCSKMRFLRMKR